MSEELLIVTPDNKTRRVPVEGDGVSLGRAHSNDLCYPEDASLSRRHLSLTRDGDGLLVEDLNSKNGTLLNGTRLSQRTRFNPGDRLTAGHLEITLVDSEHDGPVVFVPSTGPEEEQGTVMTRLADLLSNEATAPLAQPKPDPAITGVEQKRVQSFDSPVVRVLLRAGRELAAHRPIGELFQLILELSIEAVGAERGVLMALDGDKLVTKALHGDNFRISTTVRDQVLAEKKSLLVRDMQQEEAFREQHSISAQQIHTMMAVPLQTETEVIGLVYVDSRLWMREFTPDDLNLLTFLGNVAAIRIEQQRLAQLERETAQAAGIQRMILPSKAPVIEGLELAGHNAPCRTVGGDYYDYISRPDGRVAVALGDVAGKGMEAALLMSNLHPRVQFLADEATDLGEFMSRLDKSLVSHMPENRFITFFFSVINPETGELTYCNAGHNPPLLIRGNGDVSRLAEAGTALGMMPELGYTEHREQLGRGELLAIFSDGITEAADAHDEEFGEERLAKILIAERERHAEDLVDAVLEAVADWTGSVAAEDDVTLVIVRRT